MKKVPLDEYLEKADEFCKQNEEYYDICLCISNSDLFDETRKEELCSAIDAKYGDYTNIYNFEYYTDFDGEYIKTMDVKDKDIWLSILSHIGERCKTEGAEGVFKGMVVTLDDYYYVVDCDGKEQWDTAVSHIEFI